MNFFFREEEGNFSTPCESDLDPIALPSSANYEEMNEVYKNSIEKKSNQIYDPSSNQSPQESVPDMRAVNEANQGCSYSDYALVWHGPENETQQPSDSLDLENLFSTDQQGDVLSNIFLQLRTLSQY